MGLLENIKSVNSYRRHEKADNNEHGAEFKDVPKTETKDEFLLVHKDAPFIDTVRKKYSTLFNGTHYAVPYNANRATRLSGYLKHGDLDERSSIGQMLGVHHADLIPYVSTSVVPHSYSENDHYALLDVPLDMTKDVVGKAKKSNKGTYFVKIPKELHDKFNSTGFFENLKIGKMVNKKRANDLILYMNGIDPTKTNTGKMKIEVTHTYSPEQIKKMKG